MIVYIANRPLCAHLRGRRRLAGVTRRLPRPPPRGRIVRIDEGRHPLCPPDADAIVVDHRAEGEVLVEPVGEVVADAHLHAPFGVRLLDLLDGLGRFDDLGWQAVEDTLERERAALSTDGDCRFESRYITPELVVFRLVGELGPSLTGLRFGGRWSAGLLTHSPNGSTDTRDIRAGRFLAGHEPYRRGGVQARAQPRPTWAERDPRASLLTS